MLASEDTSSTPGAAAAPAVAPQETAGLSEPELAIGAIQGNLIGFNKDHQMTLFLKIHDPELFRRWLKELIPSITSADEVLKFKGKLKELRLRGENTRSPQCVWINIAMAFNALAELSADAEVLKERARSFPNYCGDSHGPNEFKAERFVDRAFKQGLARRAVSELNDPSDSTSAGNPIKWVVGGPHNEADVVIIAACDDLDELNTRIADIETSLNALSGEGIEILYKQLGSKLPEPYKGHEHFGFLDGVSQPGLRGLVSSNPKDFLTPRQNPDNPHQGKPGQDLVWPGEFLFGYNRQTRAPIPGHEDQLNTAPGKKMIDEGPVWATDGSFLVIRRLRQDVAVFRKFLAEESSKLEMDPALFATKLFGRWPSGAPVMRSPKADEPSLGKDELENNNFGYHGSSGDRDGVVCPFGAHIRKANPREDKEADGRNLNITNTQWHRMLRRGVPYGAPYDPADDRDDGDRGLLFAAYMTSIVDQFEFVVQRWVNDPNFKDGPLNDIHRSGHDPIIGQARNADESRTRHFALPTRQSDGAVKIDIVTTDQEWVIPTGGGYFFAPSIDALRLLSGAEGG
jgi:Dyp-type peroxidase family